MLRSKYLQPFVVLVLLSSCGVAKKSTSSKASTPLNELLNAPELATAHIGVSVYDPSTQKWLIGHQENKFFLPASNTKIPTCYSGLKYLGDSIVGMGYMIDDDEIAVKFTGDPSFLHPDFKQQPAFDLLKKYNDRITIFASNWKANSWGNGWAWNDFSAAYMPERSPMPIYGNTIRFRQQGASIQVTPRSFKDSLTFFAQVAGGQFAIRRKRYDNSFELVESRSKFSGDEIPFTVKNEPDEVSVKLLEDTLETLIPYIDATEFQQANWKPLKTQATDSLLKIMMHRSDNFFAEQTLLMSAYQKLGVLSDVAMIDTMLKSDFASLLQKPRWVDGSGLSRYNLFTPQSLVGILDLMRKEFEWRRIQAIFPTGGKGTLSGYYKNLSGKIFAKTGTLNGQVALSGYLETATGKTLIFSVLVNNHNQSAPRVRQLVEQFLQSVYNQY